MRSKLLHPCGAVVVAALLASSVSAADLAADATLIDALQIAVRQHPSVARARAMLEADAAREDAADAWPDPVLQLGLGLREVETALGPQKQRWALRMQVPFFGKRALRSETARHQTRAAWHRYRAAHLSAIDRAARDYYRYAELAQTTEITAQTLALIESIEAVARARYRTGQSGQRDLLKLQVELGTVEDRLRSLRDRRRSASAQLRASLGLPHGSELPWPASDLEPPAPLPSESEALEAVRTRNEALRALLQSQRARRSEVELALRERYPDWTVGIENVRTGRSDFTSFRDRGRDAWLLQLSVPVPVFLADERAAVERAEAMESSARLDVREASLEEEQRAEQLLFQIRDAERKIELYQTSILPTAEASLATAITAFRSGGSGLLDVLDAQRVLLRFQLDLVSARAERAAQGVSLWTAMGRVPPGVPDVEEGLR